MNVLKNYLSFWHTLVSANGLFFFMIILSKCQTHHPERYFKTTKSYERLSIDNML